MKPLVIGIAGPYSNADAEQRQRNLDIMTEAAVEVARRGHTPLIGVHAALAIVQALDPSEQYEAMMRISLAVVSACDALLLIAESPGANRERDLVLSKGGVIYTSMDQIPMVPENTDE